MTRHILPHHRVSHKVLVRKIAHDLNKSWSDNIHAWFSVCDITDVYYDLWDDFEWNTDVETVLDRFHCISWKHIDSEARAEIVQNVLKFMETPYLRYKNGLFYMHDFEAIAAESARKEVEVAAEAAKPRSKLRRWLDKLFGETE